MIFAERLTFETFGCVPRSMTALMIADSSSSNPLSDKFLSAYGQGGIPFAIVIPPKGPVIQLPTVMASAQPLLEGLEEAKKQTAAN